jgi:hypothetical protein
MVAVRLRHASLGPDDLVASLPAEATVMDARRELRKAFDARSSRSEGLDPATCRLFFSGRAVADREVLGDLSRGQDVLVFIAARGVARSQAQTGQAQGHAQYTQGHPGNPPPAFHGHAGEWGPPEPEARHAPAFGAPVGNSGPDMSALPFGSVVGCLLVCAWAYALGLLDVFSDDGGLAAQVRSGFGFREFTLLSMLTVAWVFTALLPWLQEGPQSRDARAEVVGQE